MSDKKDVKINVEPYHTEIQRYEGGFRWTFYASMKGGTRRKIISLKFDRWWIAYLARDLQKVLMEEREELDRLERLSGFCDEALSRTLNNERKQ